MIARPDVSEAAPYYFTYIDRVPDGDILEVLDGQGRDVLDLLRGISDAQSRHRYAADKWSIAEVVNHINDTERVFAFRALWFARGFESPLPSFDQALGVVASRAADRSWSGLVDEFQAVRAATLALFRTLPDEAWARGGIASDKRVTVRALAFITAGHVAHHLKILRERYLPAAASAGGRKSLPE
jgi:hypothetical protein